MRRSREDGDEWESNGYYPPPRNVHYGNSNGTSKLVWWILGIVATAGISEAAWLGTAVIEQKAELAALNAKMDIVLHEMHKTP